MPKINASRLRELGLTPAQQAKLIRIGQKAEQGDSRAQQFFSDRPQLVEAVTPQKISVTPPKERSQLIDFAKDFYANTPFGFAGQLGEVHAQTRETFSSALGDTLGEPLANSPVGLVADIGKLAVGATQAQVEQLGKGQRRLGAGITEGDPYEIVQGTIHTALGATPLIGPIVGGAFEAAEEGRYGSTVGTITGATASAVVPGALERASIRNAIRQQKGFASTFSTSGKFNVLDEVVVPAMEPVRAAAEQLGLKLGSTDFKGIQGVNNYARAVETAKTNVQTQFGRALAPVAKDIISGEFIRRKIFEFLDGTTEGRELLRNKPDQAYSYIEQASDLGFTRQTAAMWDATRRRLNQELSSLQNASGDTAVKILKTKGDIAAKKIALEAIKETLYDHIQSRTGVDVADLKITESALIDWENAVNKYKNSTTVDQAKFDVTGILGAGERGVASGLSFRNILIPVVRPFARFLVSPEAQATRALQKAFARRSPRLRGHSALLLRRIQETERRKKFGATIAERIGGATLE